MKVCFNWLKEYVNLDGIPIKDFCSKMTMTGSKVETYEPVGIKCEKVVSGKVISIEKHLDAEKLVVCKLDVSENYGGILQIVTGAKNLATGNVVPVALHGSVLPGNIKIKKSSLRGVKSEGMMCSLTELGLSKEQFKDAPDDGIFILPEGTPVGKNINEIFKMDDYLIDFEITPNRPDCLSVIGLAREAAATFGKNLDLKEDPCENTGEDLQNINFNVEIKAPELCPYYSAKVITNIKIGESPEFIKKRLNLMGIKSINNVVDITNYVMLEYGQPLHAFDLSKIIGNSLNVRCAKEDEKLVILDGTELTLTSKDLVIADANAPVALAGIMGGLASGINSETTNIVLESANFNAVNIRRSSKFHNIRTEASARYEKGLSRGTCEPAMQRAIALIKKYCSTNCTKFSKLLKCESPCEDLVKIKLDINFINKFLNTSFEKLYIEEILGKLGFAFEGDNIIVPYYRKDVTNNYDIAEELARIYGYNNICSTTLSGTHFSKELDYVKFKTKLNTLMLALGVSEAVTSPFENPEFYQKMLLNEDDFSSKTIKILNPLGAETSLMRTLLEPSMLKCLANNFSQKNKEVKLFEIAKEYVKQNNDAELPDEIEKLVAAFYGKTIDFFEIKGILEEIFRNFGIENNVVFEKTKMVPYCHPGMCAEVKTKSNIYIGYVGKVHPLVCSNYELCENTFLFKLDVKTLFRIKQAKTVYKPLPLYPSAERDISLVCGEDVTVLELENAIKDSAGSILESFTLFDIYRGSQIAGGEKSIAFNLVFRAKNRTLKDGEIEESIKNIKSVLEKVGAKLRG